jgi:Holliday junction resolvase RusA-like endonuclease
VVANSPTEVTQRLVWTPHTKERPRSIVLKSGVVRNYTTHATRKAEAQLRDQWLQPLIEGPVGVELQMSPYDVEVRVFSVLPCTPRMRRGDIDNYAKLVLDALNKLAWVDDRHVNELHLYKL